LLPYLIIPLVRGESLDRRAYKIPIYRILQSSLTENDFNHVYYKISDEQWIMLKIADWESSTLAIGRQLQQTIGELYWCLIYVTDFKRLEIPNDNEIWQQYWPKLNHLLSKITKKVLDSVKGLTNYLHDNQKQNSYLIEIVVFLEFYPKILPSKILESDKDTKINMEDLEMKNWLNNSKEVMSKLERFYLCWTDYAIEQETNF